MLEDDETDTEGAFTITLSATAPVRGDPCEQMRAVMKKKG